MIASDVITRVRTLLKDELPFRWEDDELLLHIDDGQVEIQRRRPDAFYTTSVSVARPTRVTATTDELQLDDRYITVITDWVMSRALLKDAEEADLARATVHFNFFQMHLS